MKNKGKIWNGKGMNCETAILIYSPQKTKLELPERKIVVKMHSSP
jgi:hypothetical protein